MKGISEKRLLALWHEYTTPMESNLLLRLIKECEELNVWKPIDSNTPKDCPISLLTEYKAAVVGYFDVRDGCFWANGMNRFYKIAPKAWQYLPTLPKEKL